MSKGVRQIIGDEYFDVKVTLLFARFCFIVTFCSTFCRFLTDYLCRELMRFLLMFKGVKNGLPCITHLPFIGVYFAKKYVLLYGDYSCDLRVFRFLLLDLFINNRILDSWSIIKSIISL